MQLYLPLRPAAWLALAVLVTAACATLTPTPSQVAATTAPPSPGPLTTVAHCTPNVVAYDVVYVRAPRYGDGQNSNWPDTTDPMTADPGADLRLLHPNCTEEVLFPLPSHQALVDAPLGNGAVLDPNLSFDGQWVVFAYLHDQTAAALNGQRGHSVKGADLYRLNLLTRQVVRLTTQAFTPNTGNNAQLQNCGLANQGENCPRIGVFNLGPAFIAQADPSRPALVFTSTRNNFVPPKPFGNGGHVLQLFRMDWDGRNVTQIGYLNQSRALHPLQLRDGRLLFTSWENQGLRDDRQFNLWVMAPDGTQWNSLSGFGENAIGHHFAAQLPNDDIAVVRYYNFNNNGFGDLVRFPLDPAGPDFAAIDAPDTYMPFQRPGQVDLTAWTQFAYALADDFPAPCQAGGFMYGDSGAVCAGGQANRVGKVTHPAAAPGGALLLVYTPGPANHNGIYVNGGSALPFYDGGLYVLNAGLAATGSVNPNQLTRLVNNPAYNEQWPRPVAAYDALFPGVAQPIPWPDLANPGEAEHGLGPNTPFGLIGSASVIWRDTAPRAPGGGGDPDPFNASHEALHAWERQGADAGLYTDNEVYAVRLLALMPATDRRYPNDGARFRNYAGERLRILGELPVRHEGVVDGNGQTDTSFLARLPADVPFTFQTLDRNGLVLNMAQTWHQVRPGEARYDCGGCHAHSRTPLAFESTVAGQPGRPAVDVALQTPLLQVLGFNGAPATVTETVPSVTVEYWRDVRPILDAKCAGCHTSDATDGNLNLFADGGTVQCGQEVLPGTYYRLAADRSQSGCPEFGLGTPPGTPDYFLTPQITRYLRGFQARESLLIWKVYGARLDGRTNATREGDLDFTPDATHPGLLTWAERTTLARWVDLGAPIDLAAPGQSWGWFDDDLRPTLWAGPTLAEGQAGPVSAVVVAAYDLESGLQTDSLSVTLNVAVGGAAAGVNLAAGQVLVNGGTVVVALPAAIDLAAANATLTVRVRDQAGHITEIVRAFGPLATAQARMAHLPVVFR